MSLVARVSEFLLPTTSHFLFGLTCIPLPSFVSYPILHFSQELHCSHTSCILAHRYVSCYTLLANLSLYVVHTICIILQFFFLYFSHRHTTCCALLEQKKEKQNHAAIWVFVTTSFWWTLATCRTPCCSD